MEYKRQIIRTVCFLAGMLIMTFGARMFVVSALGANTLDSFCVGMADTTFLSVGVWVNIAAVMMLLISVVIGRQKFKWMALVSSLAFGVFFDMWSYITKDIEITAIYIQIPLFVTALLCATFGNSIYLLPQFPITALDELMMSLKNRFDISIKVSRIILDISFTILGLIVGGPVWIGTLLIAILYGPMLQTFYRMIEQMYNRLFQNVEIE